MTSVGDENNQYPTTLSSPNSPNEKVKLTKKDKLIISLKIGLMLFIEIVLPLILFYVLKQFISELLALIVSGIPPLLAVIYGLIRKRSIDISGTIIIISFVTTGIVSSIKNDVRIHLLRESVIAGIIGLTFLITLIPIKIGSFQMRPMSYYLGKDLETGGCFGSPSNKNNPNSTDIIVKRWERNWNNYPVFRRGFRILTALWGVGFILQSPISVIIILKAPTTERAFFWTNVESYTWLVILILIDVCYYRWFIKKIPKDEPTATNQTNNQTSV